MENGAQIPLCAKLIEYSMFFPYSPFILILYTPCFILLFDAELLFLVTSKRIKFYHKEITLGYNEFELISFNLIYKHDLHNTI